MYHLPTHPPQYAKMESRPEGEAVELSTEPFSLSRLAEELLDIVGPKAVGAGVELVVDTEPELSAIELMGDPFRLRQSLIILTDNAVKVCKR